MAVAQDAANAAAGRKQCYDEKADPGTYDEYGMIFFRSATRTSMQRAMAGAAPPCLLVGGGRGFLPSRPRAGRNDA
jgi:hypothetical protein